MIVRTGIVLMSALLISCNVNATDNKTIYVGASKSIVGYDDANSNTYKVNSGYIINRNFSFELNYLNLGESSPFDGSGTLQADAFSAEVLAKYPVNDFSIYAKLGNMWWTEKGERTHWWKEAAPTVQIKNTGSDLIYGVGMSYNITQSFSIKVEYLESKVNSQAANPLSLGLDFAF
ncbi:MULTISPECIES: outer membrane beta-barrel protein [unclassified Pseudoalteromonas]|uniref:outer membrane beta-barrel protein n=1 Tax=unclassified Pseudoalteromonas TaxID=194690 RepID=UPI000C06FC95|nr:MULTISPECIES: outer membrane beta-barrel protein [unclassified Pseudoalteromonas]MDP2635731.1 outer membrane beta-barrel protein [Pseudoalteromonas sp. 1_MG-2023]PHN91320.1 hypothetical protein CSC79_03425 [Pseudoalteromonas sp. 3D05]